MSEWSTCPEVEQNAKKVSGAWIFRGTRTPVAALFENLEAGASIDDLLSWFPGVTKEQVESVIEHQFTRLKWSVWRLALTRQGRYSESRSVGRMRESLCSRTKTGGEPAFLGF